MHGIWIGKFVTAANDYNDRHLFIINDCRQKQM